MARLRRGPGVRLRPMDRPSVILKTTGGRPKPGDKTS